MSAPAEIIVTHPDQLQDCCSHLARCAVLGLDTEFVGEDSYVPQLCLIQVSTPEALYLIDPLSFDSLEEFWSVLLDPQRLLVVHAGREEIRICERHGGKPPPNLVDLQLAAGLAGYAYPLGHASLVSQLLSTSLSKGETLTDWRTRPLTREQTRYAFDDVRYLLPCYRKLDAQLMQLNRTAWLQEEVARLHVAVTPEQVSAVRGDKWQKLRGVGQLDRKRLAILRELFLCREELAAGADRPPRTILRDDLLVEIARRNPKTPGDLQVMRGMIRRYVPTFFQAVEKARAMPPAQWPRVLEREQDPPQIALVVHILSAYLTDFCLRERLASNLVASTQDLKQLVRARLEQEPEPGAELTLCTGWRAAHVLPELQTVLDGRRAIRVGDIRSETPFAYIDVAAADPRRGAVAPSP